MGRGGGRGDREGRRRGEGGGGLAPSAAPTLGGEEFIPLAWLKGLPIVAILPLRVDAPPVALVPPVVEGGVVLTHASGRRCECGCDGGVDSALVRRDERCFLALRRRRR